jgi:hypothetical protein
MSSQYGSTLGGLFNFDLVFSTRDPIGHSHLHFQIIFRKYPTTLNLLVRTIYDVWNQAENKPWGFYHGTSVGAGSPRG